MRSSFQEARSLASFGAATKALFIPCYGLMVPFRLIQPPLKKR